MKTKQTGASLAYARSSTRNEQHFAFNFFCNFYFTKTKTHRLSPPFDLHIIWDIHSLAISSDCTLPCSIQTSAIHVLFVRFVTRKLMPPFMTSVTECGSNSSGLLSNASKLYFLSICTNPTLDTILPKRKAATKRHKIQFNGFFESVARLP